ncbi:MTH865 family protein [Methanosarcina sp. Mfa9]
MLSFFPAGADTTCKVGDIEVTAGEAGKLLREGENEKIKLYE